MGYWDGIRPRGVVSAEGRKDDQDKVRMELLPPELLEAVSVVLTFGAKKYEDRNWEKGMKWSRVFGALMRHMWAWWARKDNDPETGYSHLWHAGCCLAFLIAYEQRKIGEDDRHDVRRLESSQRDEGAQPKQKTKKPTPHRRRV